MFWFILCSARQLLLLARFPPRPISMPSPCYARKTTFFFFPFVKLPASAQKLPYLKIRQKVCLYHRGVCLTGLSS